MFLFFAFNWSGVFFRDVDLHLPKWYVFLTQPSKILIIFEHFFAQPPSNLFEWTNLLGAVHTKTPGLKDGETIDSGPLFGPHSFSLLLPLQAWLSRSQCENQWVRMASLFCGFTIVNKNIRRVNHQVDLSKNLNCDEGGPRASTWNYQMSSGTHPAFQPKQGGTKQKFQTLSNFNLFFFTSMVWLKDFPKSHENKHQTVHFYFEKC